MRYIHIFIASSSELKQERYELVDLLADLNQDTFEQQGMKCKPEIWEFWDSSMREERKEEEYLQRLRICDICLVLFWRTLGEYTLEELNVAIDEMRAGRLPKAVFVLYKEPDDSISEELAQFKERFAERHKSIPVRIFDNYNSLREQVSDILKDKIATL